MVSLALANRLAKKALRMADDFCQTVIITRREVTGYDPVNDTPVENTQTYVLRGLVTNITDDEKKSMYPKTQHQSFEARKLIISSLDLNNDYTPATEDTVRIGNEDWEVVKITTPPGESIYILWLFRAV